jgi:hypothetical protein
MKSEALVRPWQANLSMRVSLNAGPNELRQLFSNKWSETGV